MTYKVVLTQTEEGYSVGCPELRGCRSEGDTKEEALDNIREAIEEYLSVQPEEEPPSEVHFVEVPRAAAGLNGTHPAAHRAPFVIVPIMDSAFPAEWTSHKVEELLTILEGPEHR